MLNDGYLEKAFVSSTSVASGAKSPTKRRWSSDGQSFNVGSFHTWPAAVRLTAFPDLAVMVASVAKVTATSALTLGEGV